MEHDAPATGQPTAAAPPPRRRAVWPIFVVLGFLAVVVAVLAVAVYLLWPTIDETFIDPRPEWTESGEGIEFLPSANGEFVEVYLSRDLAELWGVPRDQQLSGEDVPRDAEQAEAISADLAQAMRDADDRGAVFRLLCLLASEPDVRRAGDVHLLDAVALGRTNLAVGMIEAGVRDQSVDANGNHALHVAAKHNRVELVEALLRRRDLDGAFGIDDPNALGRTPLAVAAEFGNVDVVEAMVGFAAETEPYAPIDLIRSRDLGGNTPLHLAAESGHVEMVRRLIAGGADRAATNNNGQTPADLARANGVDAAADLLNPSGADPIVLEQPAG